MALSPLAAPVEVTMRRLAMPEIRAAAMAAAVVGD
jgi:hypothetical protein